MEGIQPRPEIITEQVNKTLELIRTHRDAFRGSEAAVGYYANPLERRENWRYLLLGSHPTQSYKSPERKELVYKMWGFDDCSAETMFAVFHLAEHDSWAMGTLDNIVDPMYPEAWKAHDKESVRHYIHPLALAQSGPTKLGTLEHPLWQRNRLGMPVPIRLLWVATWSAAYLSRQDHGGESAQVQNIAQITEGAALLELPPDVVPRCLEILSSI